MAKDGRVELYTGNAEEWNRFTREHEGWTLFHLYEWRDVIREVFGHECPYMAVRGSDGQLEGVLPLVSVESVIFGRYLVSMPFVNYGGPLGSPAAVDTLTGAAVDRARGEDSDLLELRNRVPMDIPLPVSHRRILVVMDLPEDPEVLWKDFPSKMRNKIRKPRKEGVEIRFGPDQLDPFFSVFSHHMRDLGTPTQPRELFATAREAFGERMWFGCAYLDGEPIACGCGFRWKDEFEMTWASMLMEHRDLRANMELYWAFMERAIESGATLFNFGRCPPDSGTHRFKQQWGGRDEELWWYQHASNGRTATPTPDESSFSWGPAIWKRLPVSVATALGPKIVRYIP